MVALVAAATSGRMPISSISGPFTMPLHSTSAINNPEHSQAHADMALHRRTESPLGRIHVRVEISTYDKGSEGRYPRCRALGSKQTHEGGKQQMLAVFQLCRVDMEFSHPPTPNMPATRPAREQMSG